MRAEAVFTSPYRVELSCPYHADFVAALKGAIPSRNRSWHPEEKTWEVFGPSLQWADYAIDLLLDFFPDAIIHEWAPFSPPPPGAGPGPPPPTHDVDYAVLHLLPSAPPELIAAAYKVLAKVYHPDRGGDDGRMRALNLAMDHLRQRGAA